MRFIAALKSKLLQSPPIEDQGAKSGMHDSEASLISMISPEKMAAKFRAAEQGNIHEQQLLFDMMEQRDSQIFSELSKRRRALTSVPWKLVPPTDATDQEIEQTNLTESLLRETPNLNDALFDVTDAFGKGFSYLSIEWGLMNDHNAINKLTFNAQSKFVVDPDDKNKLRLRKQTVHKGEELIDYGWIRHRHAAISGDLHKSSLFRVLAWIFVFKHFPVKYLARFLEAYGLPIRVGKYKGNPGKKDKLTLLRAARDLGFNGYGIMPDTMELDFKEAGKGRSGDFLDVMGYWDMAISKAVLGGTLTSQADGKSSTNALGNIHNDVRKELTESDAMQVAETLTRDLVVPLQMFNGLATPGRYAKFEFELLEEVNQKELVDVFDTGVKLGLRIPVSWAHKKLQIPLAKEDDNILFIESNTDGAVVGLKHAALKSNNVCNCPTCQSATATALKNTQKFPADIIGEQLTAATKEDIDNWLSIVESILEAADSLEEAHQMVLGAFTQIASEEVAFKIADGLTVSNLAGQYDVEAASE